MNYTLKFNIEYFTKWGEDLRVQIRYRMKDGNLSDMEEIRLSTEDGRIWRGYKDVQNGEAAGVQYLYAMYRDDVLVWTEWEIAPHKVSFSEDTWMYDIEDRWRPIPEDLPLFSSAYTECVGAAEESSNGNLSTARSPYSITLQLRTVEPRLKKGEHLAICGSTPQLGEWRSAGRLPSRRVRRPRRGGRGTI